jgi:hypothetical protein
LPATLLKNSSITPIQPSLAFFFLVLIFVECYRSWRSVIITKSLVSLKA